MIESIECPLYNNEYHLEDQFEYIAGNLLHTNTYKVE